MLTKSRPNLFDRVNNRIQKSVKRAWRNMTDPKMVSTHSLSDEAFLALFDIEAVTKSLNQGNTDQAKAALLTYYEQRIGVGWPDFPSRIIDYGIDIETISLDDLLEKANLLLNHRFVLHDLPEVAMGRQIDWHHSPTSDPAWGWGLNRHKWLPALAWAYRKTRDERYTDKLIHVLMDWIDRNPPPPRKDEKSPTWRLMEVGQRMYLSWIPIFGMLYSLPIFSDEAKLKMLRAICDHARFLSLFYTNRNHLVRESIGLAFVALYFPEFKEAAQWQELALSRLDDELAQQINEDGSQIEMSTGYQWLLVDECHYLYDLLKDTGQTLPKVDISVRLEKMVNLLVHLIRPDYTFPYINDGGLHRIEILRDTLRDTGEDLSRPDFVYAGTSGQQGLAPNELSTHFPDAGFHIMRSGWQPDARYLFFSAGPFGGPHGHEDKLHFELYAYGQPFIVDPGTYTYDRNDPFRLFFVGSDSHNVVTVDDKSQVRRWDKANLDPKPASGKFATWISQPDFDYVTATYGDGYGDYSLRQSPDDEVVAVTHTRHILFVKPSYWLMIDELEAAQPHIYQQLFHLPPEMQAHIGADNRVSIRESEMGPSLQLVWENPAEMRINAVQAAENPIQGWYSSRYNDKQPSTTILCGPAKCASTVIMTLLYPCPASDQAAMPTVEKLAVSGGAGYAVVVSTEQGKDYLMVSPDNQTKQFGPYQSAARVAGFKTNAKGAVLKRFGWPGDKAS